MTGQWPASVVMGWVAAERRELADLLDGLDDDGWRTPSLCPGWTVHDVAAHLISYEDRSWTQVATTVLRHRGSLAGANAEALRRWSERPRSELVAGLRRHATPRGVTALRGGAIGLTDGLIHHQDIRRPLGLLRDIPPERLQAVLTFAPKAPVLPAGRLLRRVTMAATDLDWRAGRGPLVEGPAEALVMALAGRPVGATELSGPGTAALG